MFYHQYACIDLISESVNSKRRSQLIDKELLQAKRELEKHKEDPRVLILGSGDSGKTTLLKQLKIKFSGFSDDDRGFYKKHIRANLWNNFLLIVGKAQEMHLEISNPDVRVSCVLLLSSFLSEYTVRC